MVWRSGASLTAGPFPRRITIHSAGQRLCLRKFPGSHQPIDFNVTIDRANRTAVLETLPQVPLGEVEELMEQQQVWR